MSDSIQFGNPDQINTVEKLEVQTVSGNLSPQIFANGKNQLPIRITIKALNDQKKPLIFPKVTWINILNLRFADSEETLNWRGFYNWGYTDVKNEYRSEIKGDLQPYEEFVCNDDGSVSIVLYIYSRKVGTKTIMVSVDIDNGKQFIANNTTGADKMYIKIEAIPKINYGKLSNLTINVGDFVTLASSLGWTSRLSTIGPFKEHYDGSCKRRIVSIKPNTSSTGQTQFKEYVVDYNHVRNWDVSEGTVSWSEIEDAFNILKPNASHPVAVMGSGSKYSDYEINIWYAGKCNVHIDGQVYLADDYYYYRFCPYVKENNTYNNKDGSVKFFLYKFIMPEKDTYKWKWHDVKKEVLVSVTDFYGNNGDIKLRFNHNFFDTPDMIDAE